MSYENINQFINQFEPMQWDAFSSNNQEEDYWGDPDNQPATYACFECGSLVIETDRYCWSCGTPLTSNQEDIAAYVQMYKQEQATMLSASALFIRNDAAELLALVNATIRNEQTPAMQTLALLKEISNGFAMHVQAWDSELAKQGLYG